MGTHHAVLRSRSRRSFCTTERTSADFLSPCCWARAVSSRSVSASSRIEDGDARRRCHHHWFRRAVDGTVVTET